MSERIDESKAASNWPSAFKRLDDSESYIKSNREPIAQHETANHEETAEPSLKVFVVNGLATILVFIFHLISLETLLSIGMSVGFTFYVYNRMKNDDTIDGTIMNWILLSFAIVTPLTSSITMAFRRRDRALLHIASLRSSCFGIYQAHCCWDWEKKPKDRQDSGIDWEEHTDALLNELLGIGDDLCRYLTLPNVTRARHKVIPYSKDLAADVREVGDQLIDSLLVRMSRIALFCEVLKLEGLPGNEAARIRQWERSIVLDVDALQTLKEYRTPQALRSLCRIFSVFLPPFYAPFYAQMAHDLSSIGMGIAFAILVCVALTALFSSLIELEDPFVANLTLDGIDVPLELKTKMYKRLLSQRDNIFFKDSKKPFAPRGISSSS